MCKKHSIQFDKNDIEFRTKDNNEWSPIFHATWLGLKDLVSILIKLGYDVNVQEFKFGYTPLMAACMTKRNNLGLAKLLIDNGADLEIPNQMGDTALLFLGNLAGNEKTIQLMKLLVAYGANTKARNQLGNSLYHNVVRSDRDGSKGLRKYVETLDIDFDAKNNEGLTAIDQ